MKELIYAITCCVCLIALMGWMQQDDEQHREIDRQAVKELPTRYNYAQHVDRDTFGQLVQSGNELGHVAYVSAK